MKRIFMKTLLASTLMAFAATFAWAQAGPRETEESALTGQLLLSEGEIPALRADGETYELRIPFPITDELDVRSGQTVTVEGYRFQATERDLVTNTNVFMVRAMEVDGERSEMPNRRFGFGRRRGARGARGARGCYGGPGFGRRRT